MKQLLIVANLYPTSVKPHHGTFVKSCHDGYLQEGVPVEKAVLERPGAMGYLLFYIDVVKTILTKKPDVVHVHYVSHSVLPVLVAKLFQRFSLVLNFHGSDAFSEKHEGRLRNSIKQTINKSAIHYCKAVVTPSKYFASALKDAYKITCPVIVSPSGGVDVRKFRFKLSDTKSVLFAGRMLEEKGAITAANAIADNASRIETVSIVGEGPELLMVKDILYRTDAKFQGLLPHDMLAREMSVARFFLFPSVRKGESLGLVVVEAILSGAIPLVINNGAMREVIPEKYHSLLVVENQAEYSRKLTELLEMSDSELDEIATALYEVTLNNYSSQQVATRLITQLKSAGIEIG